MFRSPGIRILCGITVLVIAAFVLLGSGSSSNIDRVSAEGSAPSTEVTREAGQLVDPATTTTVLSPSTSPADTSPADTGPEVTKSVELPADSGTGKRMVMSISQQRVWWVDESGAEIRTALVSGRANTPQTGTFQVYSKTENATGLDGSKMNYFVRFTKGPQGWAIGFHNIPKINGEPVQTEEQLGQTMSHGCIRQAEADAVFTWSFLDIGSTVVVLA
jgi:lipoprotein-anchoring transpeptidase ErfK/SrfK